MGRAPKSFQDTLKLLRSIDDMPAPRVEKCEVLYDLAKNVDNGCIVELGTYHGIGAITLYFGAEAGHGADVFTVDDYKTRSGWAGEVYAAPDQYIYYDNVKKTRAQPLFIKSSFEWLGYTWWPPIGLLFWDAGMPKPAMLKHIREWFPVVVEGGIIYLHDTFANLLGSRDVIREFKDEIEVIRDDPGFCIVKKSKKVVNHE
jgi:predicted O-methyltransferase YrrM